MSIEDKIRLLIRERIERFFDEERIPNPEADEFVDRKENFVGSHTYGEDIGDLHKMYVAYSYGEQHPLFVWVAKEEFKALRPYEADDLTEGDDEKEDVHLFDKDVEHEKVSDNGDVDLSYKEGPWFFNEKPYYVKNKKGRLHPNKWTLKHLKNLKPNEKIQARETTYLQKLIRDFKLRHRVGGNTHTDLKPGEK